MNDNGAIVKRSRTTRILHWLAALAILAQLALSLVMRGPEPNRPGDSWFEVHEKVGIAAAAILVAFWLWSVVRSGETRFVAFFPWFSPPQLKLVLGDARRLFAPLHEGRSERPFASAIHGLGLIVATVMAATGLLGYFVASARSLLGVHGTVAPLMWAYLAGHVGISIIHEVRGERIVAPMFRLGEK